MTGHNTPTGVALAPSLPPVACPPRGPISAPITIIGDFPSSAECRAGHLFTTSGILASLLKEAHIDPTTCHYLNVFNFRVPQFEIAELCASKAEVGGSSYHYPALATGQYLRPEFFPLLDDFWSHVDQLQSNTFVALGNTASWALLGQTGISKIRGAISEAVTPEGKHIKVLPTFHPGSIIKTWNQRPIAVFDLMKARRESLFPEVRRPFREVKVLETVADIEEMEADLADAEMLSVDIETKGEIITCLGFAPTTELAYVVPLFNTSPAEMYWKTEREEILIWQMIQRLLASPTPKVMQNGMYDIQYLWRHGCAVKNFTHDTMICHHVLQPELPKGLGFLGSIYANEASWKLMRRRGQHTLKKDE